MKKEKIALASDHAGYKLKESLKNMLIKDGYEVKDLGTDNEESVDYPDFAKKMAQSMKKKEAMKGILICGTGAGMTMAINRYPFIRGALIHNAYTAEMSRKHNDANVMILGGRVTAMAEAKKYAKTFLNTEFEGGRHLRRLKKLEGKVS